MIDPPPTPTSCTHLLIQLQPKNQLNFYTLFSRENFGIILKSDICLLLTISKAHLYFVLNGHPVEATFYLLEKTQEMSKLLNCSKISPLTNSPQLQSEIS